MTFGELYRYLMFGLSVATFVGALRYVNRAKMSALQAMFSGAAMITFAAALYEFDHVTWHKPSSSVWSFLVFNERGIWYGSSIVAAGYGMLAYAVVRLFLREPEKES